MPHVNVVAGVEKLRSALSALRWFRAKSGQGSHVRSWGYGVASDPLHYLDRRHMEEDLRRLKG